MLKHSWIFAASSTALAAALASPVFASPADFVGTWVNANPNTRGVTRLIITPAGSNKLDIQVFGSCHPTDCVWGKKTLVTYGSNVQDKNHHYGTANYDSGFAQTLLNLNLQDKNAINLQSFTQFTDNSGRQNYSSIESFKR